MANPTIARQKNGTIQFTFVLPWKEVSRIRNEVAVEMGQSKSVPGFRKGKAPLAKLLTHLPSDDLTQHTLNHILPKVFSEAVEKEKIRPAIYPKFEIISVNTNEDWQVRATTADLPEVRLGVYKAKLKKIKAKTPEEKEQKVIDVMVSTAKVQIPDLLIDEEVNNRLSSLLERIEKLGLNLDAYLASVKKTPESIRDEYKESSQKSIKLELILGKVFNDEKMSVDKKEIEAFSKAAQADPNVTSSTEQKRAIENVLRRRKALDKLVTLVT